jgi:hypothetical protein
MHCSSTVLLLLLLWELQLSVSCCVFLPPAAPHWVLMPALLGQAAGLQDLSRAPCSPVAAALGWHSLLVVLTVDVVDCRWGMKMVSSVGVEGVEEGAAMPAKTQQQKATKQAQETACVSTVLDSPVACSSRWRLGFCSYLCARPSRLCLRQVIMQQLAQSTIARQDPCWKALCAQSNHPCWLWHHATEYVVLLHCCTSLLR